MQNPNVNPNELTNEALPKEAQHVLKVLEELENFTAQLRKKVMNELKNSGTIVHLKLDEM